MKVETATPAYLYITGKFYRNEVYVEHGVIFGFPKLWVLG